MLHTFIRTKLNVPAVRRGALERDALIQKLNRGADGRVLLVTAPAGYGKTTLVTQWLQQQDREIAWITLDENDSSSDLFFNLLMSAVDNAIPDFDGVPFPPQGDPDVQQAALYGLINSLAEMETSLVIVLDDYHTITDPEINLGLDLLIDHLPPNVLLVFTSRERPGLSLPRWRARGWITEISQNDLKFDVAQSGRFFRETMDITVTDELVEQVSKRVDGWVTGLQFTGLRLQNNHEGDELNLERVDNFSADYLLAEVLEKEPAETQQFLLKTSILGRLCGPLCNAILQIDSAQEQLESMEARSLFTLPLDNHREWFRYHPLMADLLKAKLLRERPEEDIVQLHRDAAAWFHENGWLEESISHALAAEDHHLAAKHLSNIKSSYLWEENGATNLARWLEQLPDHFVVEYPQLGVLAIGSNLLRGQLGNTLHILDQLEGIEEIEGYWWAFHGNIKRNAGQIDEALDDLEKAVRLLDYDDPTWVMLVYLQTVLCHQERGDLAAAKGLISDVVHIFEEHKPHESPYMVSVMLNWLQGIMSMFMGNHYDAKELFEDGLKLSRKAPLHRRTVRGYILNGLSRLHYLWNELDAAEDYAQQSMEIGKRTGISDYTMSSLVQLINIAATRGDRPAALDYLNELDDRIRRAKFEPFGDMFELFYIDVVHMRLEDGTQAIAWLEKHDFYNLTELDLIDRDQYLLWAEVHLFILRQAAPDVDHEACQRLIDFCSKLLQTGRAASDFMLSLYMHLILAELYDFQGDVDARNQQMISALNMADVSGVIQPLVEIRPIVAKVAEQIDRPQFRMLDRILQAAESSQPVSGVLPDLDIAIELTGRELDVLRSLAEGLSNKEIESKHVISRNTVRTHLRNLYSKLDVSSRTQAVLKAQEMGLI